jgi:hypothetical protein
MAVLQAARAFVLGLPEESAKSWGLNRAIFYAAAKRGFQGSSPLTEEFRAAKARVGEEAINLFKLGDEVALKEVRDGKLYFRIGGRIQTEADFARQIESKFGDLFGQVWEEAINIVKSYDRSVLLSQQGFYEKVYLPRRDALAKAWSELVLKAKARVTR